MKETIILKETRLKKESNEQPTFNITLSVDIKDGIKEKFECYRTTKGSCNKVFECYNELLAVELYNTYLNFLKLYQLS